tara:strand:- start:1083 stop:2255 length:1173 start_codon:yes stop_codon:yes gene_type:complete
MAYYYIFPETDTTLYSHPDRKTMNAGSDELLELVKEPGSTDQYHHPSRILIKFKNDDILKAITLMGDATFTSSADSTVNLQLQIADTKNLTSTHVINAHAVSQSWDEGTGRYLNLPTASNGSSWIYRDNTTVATKWATSSFGVNGGTGSISSSLLTQGGGTYYTGSDFYGTQQFLEGEVLDTNIDVKSIVNKYSASLNAGKVYPEGILNYGFLLKTLDSVEADVNTSFGEIQYFSSNTHTIYPPKLEFAWNDVINQTGNYDTNLIKRSGSLHISLEDNKKEFNQEEIVKIRINVRDKYPERSFDNESNYLKNNRLKTGKSSYSIRDAHTERVIIPFHDVYTNISNDGESSFFKLYMNGLQPERYYRILIKLEEITETQIFDDNYFFKVVR